eukprot:gene20835-24976_t
MSYHYYIFDVLLYTGKNVMQETLIKRLDLAKTIYNQIRDCSHFSIHTKDFLELDKFNNDTEYPFKTDGLIFTPINEPIAFGTNYSLYKWKDGLENTIDFYIDERFQMFLLNKSQLYLTKETIHDEDIRNTKIPFPCIVECRWHSLYTWNIIKQRIDKDHPNSVYTFSKTMKNIEEDIKIHDLFNHL